MRALCIVGLLTTRVLALVCLYSGAVVSKIGDILLTASFKLNDLYIKIQRIEANK